MAEQKKLNRRRHYIIDSKAQIGPTSQIVTTLIIVCIVFAVGLLYLLAVRLRPSELRVLLNR